MNVIKLCSPVRMYVLSFYFKATWSKILNNVVKNMIKIESKSVEILRMCMKETQKWIDNENIEMTSPSVNGYKQNAIWFYFSWYCSCCVSRWTKDEKFKLRCGFRMLNVFVGHSGSIQKRTQRVYIYRSRYDCCYIRFCLMFVSIRFYFCLYIFALTKAIFSRRKRKNRTFMKIQMQKHSLDNRFQ